MKERCPCCDQWLPDVQIDMSQVRRERLVKGFAAGKKYRVHKMKLVGEPFEDFDALLELEKEGLIQRQTQPEEWQDTITFTWVGPKK